MVVEILDEGGAIEIHRIQAPNGTRKFYLKTDESTMASFTDEFDPIDLVKKYPQVDSFKEAVLLMNKYPWHKLHISKVHPEYVNFIRGELRNRLLFDGGKFMNAHGQFTSAVARSITDKMNSKGYDVYFDHGQAGEFVGTIAISIEEKLSRQGQISQLDIAIVERDSNRAIALIEIEETTDNPKTLIGDIFAVLMGNSVYCPGRKVEVGKWTTLIIIGKGEGHKDRNEYIQNLANLVKYNLGTNNSRIGNIVIESVSVNDDLEEVLLNIIDKAI